MAKNVGLKKFNKKIYIFAFFKQKAPVKNREQTKYKNILRKKAYPLFRELKRGKEIRKSLNIFLKTHLELVINFFRGDKILKELQKI